MRILRFTLTHDWRKMNEASEQGGEEAPPPEGFLSSIPEADRPAIERAGIKDIPSLAKSFIHAQGMVGADTVKIPGEGATEDEMSAFFKAAGRPDEANGYGIMHPENLPEGLEFSDESLNEYLGVAHQAGLSKGQAKSLYDWYMGGQVKAFEAYNADAEASEKSSLEAIKAEFGEAANERIALAQEAVGKFGGQELRDYLESTGLGNHPAMVKAFAEIGKVFKEHSTVGDGSSSFTMTPSEAQAEIARLQGDSEFMTQYQNNNIPGHAEAVQKMGQLFEWAHPSQGTRLGQTGFTVG